MEKLILRQSEEDEDIKIHVEFIKEWYANCCLGKETPLDIQLPKGLIGQQVMELKLEILENVLNTIYDESLIYLKEAKANWNIRELQVRLASRNITQNKI